MLSCRLEHAGLARGADKEGRVAIEVIVDDLFPLIELLGLVYGADLGVLLFCEGAGSNSSVPGNGPLADVALQGSEVGGRIERHVDAAAVGIAVAVDGGWCGQ